MVFSSPVYLFIFLPLLLAVYYMLPRIWMKNVFLFISSLIFYTWGGGIFLFLLLGTGIMLWIFSFLTARTRFKTLFMILAVATFAGILVYYKVIGAYISIFSGAGNQAGFGNNAVMPLGVSFIIFQAISYIMDVYRKNERFEKNPAYVMLYITMFPQLISGPLTRFQQLSPAFKSRTFDVERFTEGVRRFIIGLGKKALIANPLGIMAAKIMETDTEFMGPAAAWLGVLAGTLQIFFDFSGYTDMAIGTGKMLGFNLPENFNYPFISRSITDFWRRWHMSLSAWLRDYIFSPLAMRMRYWGKTGIFIALLVTFIICGAWHGLSWNLVIWGGIQGLFLGLEEAFLRKHLERLKAWAVIYTLLITIFGFVFVITPSPQAAMEYLSIMLSPGMENSFGADMFLTNETMVLVPLAIFLCIPWPLPKRFSMPVVLKTLRYAETILLIAICMLSLMAVMSQTNNPFIYFRF